MDQDSQYYSQALKFFVREKHVPVKRILAEANISRSRFYAYINGAGDLAMTRLVSILNVLNISLNDFLLYARLLKQDACQTIPATCPSQQHTLPEQIACAVATARATQNHTQLAEVLRRMQLTLDESTEKQIIQPILPLVMTILGTTAYYTAAEIELFLVAMPHLSYKQLQLSYPKAQAALTQRIAVTHETSQHFSDYLVEMQYHMMLAQLKNHETSAGIRLAAQITALPTGQLAWHANFIKKMVAVVMAILQQQGQRAQILYSKLVEMIYFIQPTEQWLSYEKLLCHDFKQLQQVVLATK